LKSKLMAVLSIYAGRTSSRERRKGGSQASISCDMLSIKDEAAVFPPISEE